MAQVDLVVLMRNVLTQGAAIHHEYTGGMKFPNYEAYSRRIDEAAKERAEALEILISKDYVRSALEAIMRYPGIREYIGSQLSEHADKSLQEAA